MISYQQGTVNKIPPTLQGIMLKSQLFGRAVDLGSHVSHDELTSANGSIVLAKAVYKTDSLSNITKLSGHFNELSHCARSERESLKQFQRRFEAQKCIFFSESCDTDVLPDAIICLPFMKKFSNREFTKNRIAYCHSAR